MRCKYAIKRISAFTLIELLVVMALLIILGLMLIKILSGAMEAWRYSESQRRLHNYARSTLAVLTSDLESLYSNTQNDDIRLIVDNDRHNRQRLRFIRRLPESSHAVLRDSGRQTVAQGYHYYFRLGQDNPEQLRASGGLAEVVYLTYPQSGSFQLWRGVRMPLDGKGSYFNNSNIERPEMVQGACHLLADDILYFGIECQLRQPQGQNNGKARETISRLWDSSRKQLRNFALYAPGAPAVFPDKIRITLLLKGDHTPQAFLDGGIDEKQQQLKLCFARNFPVLPEVYGNMVRIGDEWLSYSVCRDDALEGVKRGQEYSKAQIHQDGTPVYWGTKWTVTVFLPTHHAPWAE